MLGCHQLAKKVDN